jgi:tol-pal system protein YbgF
MKRSFLLAVFLSLALAGCSVSTLGSGGSTDEEVEELKRRVVELQRQAAVTEVELARLREQLARLEAQLAGRQPPALETHFERATPAQPFASPIQPPPEIEEQDLGESRPPAASRPKGQDSADRGRGVTTAESSLAPITPAAQALYDRGYTLYHQGHYLDAESSFQRFLQAYSDTELADNAQYWIGECRYRRDDLRGALAAFRETVERYPDGNKVPDALLKAGQCLAALGDVEGARISYQEVERRFPGSPAAATAEEHRSKLP